MTLDFAAILREHVSEPCAVHSAGDSRYWWQCEGCGWTSDVTQSRHAGLHAEAHTAHVAAVLQAAVREAANPLIERWEDESVNDHSEPCLDLEDCALCCAQDLRALVGVEQ